MSFEGVWKVEMLGAYGWENVSTAFLQQGRYYGASTDHYSIGRYDEEGDTINVMTRITQHGKTRTVFGVNSEKIDVRMVGAMEKAGVILGKAYPSDNSGFDVNLRLTRLSELVGDAALGIEI